MATKTYSREELRAFEHELELYRVTKTVGGKDISYINFDDYLVSKHACVRRDGDYAPAICNVSLFEELGEKWDQLRDLIGKRAYAKAKELEELASNR